MLFRSRFLNAVGGTIDPDRTEAFILNTTSDTSQYAVYKFDKRGRFKKESIHPNAAYPPIFFPTSATFSDRVLYISATDSFNTSSRIIRFKLSTDFIR